MVDPLRCVLYFAVEADDFSEYLRGIDISGNDHNDTLGPVSRLVVLQQFRPVQIAQSLSSPVARATYPMFTECKLQELLPDKMIGVFQRPSGFPEDRIYFSLEMFLLERRV